MLWQIGAEEVPAKSVTGSFDLDSNRSTKVNICKGPRYVEFDRSLKMRHIEKRKSCEEQMR